MLQKANGEQRSENEQELRPLRLSYVVDEPILSPTPFSGSLFAQKEHEFSTWSKELSMGLEVVFPLCDMGRSRTLFRWLGLS